MGGFHEIIIGLSKLAKEKGVIINCDSNVEKINVVNGKVENIVVNGEKLLFDGVIASAVFSNNQPIYYETINNVVKDDLQNLAFTIATNKSPWSKYSCSST
ncbi:hypothetical protein N9K77_00720 [bacterium]|nr:hypothetical protein [bacterium]